MEIVAFILLSLGLIFAMLMLISLFEHEGYMIFTNSMITVCLFVSAAVIYFIIIPSGDTGQVYYTYEVYYTYNNNSARVSEYIQIVKSQCVYNKYRADDVCEELYAKPIKQTTIDKIEPGQ